MHSGMMYVILPLISLLFFFLNDPPPPEFYPLPLPAALPTSRLFLSRKLLGQVHSAFGGELRAIIVGGAFTEPQTLQFFYDLGIPVANGYGLTEAVTEIGRAHV